jgi:IS605 OrfB family transposase
MINTIETRLKLDLTRESEIDSCVILWSTFYRKIWKLFNNQHLAESDIYHQIMSLGLLTSYQVKSIFNKVKSEHSKIKELTKSQLKQHQSKLDNINKFIVKEQKIIAKHKKEILTLQSKKKLDYSKIAKLSNSINKKQLVINQKFIKVKRLTKSINILQQRIDSNTFKLCFGSSQLLSQRLGNHSDKFRLTDKQKVYHNLADWRLDWDLSRNNIWYSVGSKDKPQGNAEVQYYPKTKKLKLRLTEQTATERLKNIASTINIPFEELNDNKNHKYSLYRMEARFIEISDVEFCAKNQAKIIQAIKNQQPISAKIIKKLSPNGKDIGFYLQLSFDEVIQKTDNVKINNLTMGIDLNQKGLAYCIVKQDGNKLNHSKSNNIQYKPQGFISWDLENKSTEQRQWLISNAITEVLAIAQSYGIYNIAIENLDFSSTINNMNSGYKSNQNYNRMLTQFAKGLFQDLIKRKTERLGMKLYLVNPTYSSVGGFTKYGFINKLKVDIAAALWLARQSIYGKEFKEENHIKYIKKYNEDITFPYLNQSKQSKRENLKKLEWKDVSSALGKNRNQWYKNIMKFIQLKVVESQSNQSFNPFELNQE